MHIVVALTPHGYGHAALTAPLINRLRRLFPASRLTLQTNLPQGFLASRFEGDFALEAGGRDFGLRMFSANRVDVEASAAEYVALHRELPSLIKAAAERLRDIKVDLLVTSISYIAIAAAKRAGVPAVGISSLNWADIYQAYMRGRPEAAQIHGEMLAAYAQADVILRPSPAMPMASLSNTRSIGPVVWPSNSRRDELPQGGRLGLLAFGGMPPGYDFGAWPRVEGWRWICEERLARPDFLYRPDLGLAMPDLVASVDLVVTKPGYGTFTECAVAGTPLIYVPRPDWPETPYMADWLRNHVQCAEIPEDELFSDCLARHIEAVLAQPKRPKAVATGAEEGAALIPALLQERRVEWPTA